MDVLTKPHIKIYFEPDKISGSHVDELEEDSLLGC